LKYPEEITQLLDGYETFGENHRTSSEAEIYLYQKSGSVDLFLKIRSGDVDAPLVNEKEAMVWLDGKLPVPRVVGYCQVKKKEYLLTEGIEGTSSYLEPHRSDTERTVRILVEGLKDIHAVDITDCPFPNRCADALVEEAERNVAEGVVTAEFLAENGDDRTVGEALAEIKMLKPNEETMVFTHGDYCLPNILLHQGELAGFIDWGSVGGGDRHRDFVAAKYSVHRNLGAEWVAPFFDLYGTEHLDEDKLAFYDAIYNLT